MRHRTICHPFKISARLESRMVPQRLDEIEASILQAKEQGTTEPEDLLIDLLEKYSHSIDPVLKAGVVGLLLRHTPEPFSGSFSSGMIEHLMKLMPPPSAKPRAMLRLIEDAAFNLKKFDPEDAVLLSYYLTGGAEMLKYNFQQTNHPYRQEFTDRLDAVLDTCVSYFNEAFKEDHLLQKSDEPQPKSPDPHL